MVFDPDTVLTAIADSYNRVIEWGDDGDWVWAFYGLYLEERFRPWVAGGSERLITVEELRALIGCGFDEALDPAQTLQEFQLLTHQHYGELTALLGRYRHPHSQLANVFGMWGEYPDYYRPSLMVEVDVGSHHPAAYQMGLL